MSRTLTAFHRPLLTNLLAIACTSLLLFACGGGGGGGGSSSDSGPSNALMGGGFQGLPLSLSGAVTTMAGTGNMSGTTDATGAAARFNTPSGMTTDGTNLYVADAQNHVIRKVVIATGVVTTFAGVATQSGNADGSSTTARFYGPSGITTDGTNLYVADAGNHTIRQIVIATGTVSTLAGTAGTRGSNDGIGGAARFYSPQGITTDGTRLYVADTNNDLIRQIVIATRAVSTFNTSPYWRPVALTTDGTNLYVADTQDNVIRKIVIATGVDTVIAGDPAFTSGTADGTGTSARFYYPQGVTSDGTNLYITDGNNNTIRNLVIATGVVTTIAGTASPTGGINDGSGALAQFKGPYGITSDGHHLFISDSLANTIRVMQ